MEGQYRIADQFILKTGAARALNAAFAVEEDQIAQRVMLRQVHLIGQRKARIAFTVAHRQVLQRTFAALVADRAVQRVAGQQKFNDVIARFFDLRRRGADGQAFADDGRTSGGHFRLPADDRLALCIELRLLRILIDLYLPHFDQAHAAHASGRQLRMVAEYRNVVAERFGGIDQIFALRDGVGDVVDINGDSFGHRKSSFFKIACRQGHKRCVVG